VVTAFVKRRAPVTERELEQFCRTSGLANFKRPRRFVFVDALPKSPVGKLLRRLLVSGDYQREHAPPSTAA
jgi:2-furoate---CoA ligase